MGTQSTRRITSICGTKKNCHIFEARTEGLYKTKGGIFIDLVVNDKIDENRLVLIFKKIFDKAVLPYEKRTQLIATLDKIKKYELRIFKESPKFNSLEINNSINRIIKNKL